MSDDAPMDPFFGDPADPAHALDDDEAREPLSPTEREDALTDLEDLEVFRALLEPGGVRGVVIDCGDCGEPHYLGWELIQANLRHLLDAGQSRVHEPPFDPDPQDYVTWEYARGFADGAVHTAGADDRDPADTDLA